MYTPILSLHAPAARTQKLHATTLGIVTYRFSLAWSRIIPLGGRDDPVNEKGIACYNRLIDTLLAHGIVPSVTLYHWDAPQALYDRYKAFLNKDEFRADYMRYACLCFTRFGDRVKSWVTFNEPYIISIFGHLNGSLAPGHCREMGADTKTGPWLVGHTLILSHALVIQMYTKEFQPEQKGKISIVLNGHFYVPHDAIKQADIDAAQIWLEFYIGWLGDTIFLGKDYPAPMREYLGARLPSFTSKDLELLKSTSSVNAFYGMNHYLDGSSILSIWCAWLVIGMTIIFFLYPETKGPTLEEIAFIFHGPKAGVLAKTGLDEEQDVGHVVITAVDKR